MENPELNEFESVYTGTIRGVEVNVKYNKTLHSANISVDKEIFDSTESPFQVESALEEVGVYARVSSISSISDGSIVAKLKPASGVELRDKNGVLKKRPVSNPTESSVITRQRGSNRFSATAPISGLKKLGIADKGPVSLSLSVSDSGTLAFEVEQIDSAHSLMARCDKGGTIQIPSSVGTAAGLDGHGVEWTYVESDDVLHGVTTLELSNIAASSVEDAQHFISSVTRKEQEVERSGDSWTQEHFQTYIRSQHAEELEWADDELVDIRFARSGDVLCIIVSTDIREGYTDPTPCVKRLSLYGGGGDGSDGSQLNMYIPNAIAYSAGLTESIRWVVIDSELVGWRAF